MHCKQVQIVTHSLYLFFHLTCGFYTSFHSKNKKQNASKSKKRNCNAKHLRIVRLGRLDKQKQYNNYFDCRANGVVLFFIFSYNKKMFQARVNKNYCWLETRITVMGVLISALADYRSPNPQYLYARELQEFLLWPDEFFQVFEGHVYLSMLTPRSTWEQEIFSSFIQIALFRSYSRRIHFEVSM